MTRSRNQITLILDTLNVVWNKYPDLRLGQLLSNAIKGDVDLFYVEDDALEQLLFDYDKTVEQSKKWLK